MLRPILCAFVITFGMQAAGMSGYISDAACGWNNARESKEAKECAQKCVKAGWEPVFILDGKMDAYKIRGKANVMPFIGDHVSISGKLDGDVVTVTAIRKFTSPKASPTDPNRR